MLVSNIIHQLEEKKSKLQTVSKTTMQKYTHTSHKYLAIALHPCPLHPVTFHSSVITHRPPPFSLSPHPSHSARLHNTRALRLQFTKAAQCTRTKQTPHAKCQSRLDAHTQFSFKQIPSFQPQRNCNQF